MNLRTMLCNNETEELKAFKSSDTLDLKPLYVGASEYQKLMDKLKKKNQGNNNGT